ncbi:MAG: helix-turn-helix transcriptional regulator [Bacteriovoracaceae bacterium]|jgi:hypothetical protein|nr:helix-turn-helix transcriptional regulator [Bacteriovoracaceae bacterium]
MVDLHSILAEHHAKDRPGDMDPEREEGKKAPTVSKIPDLFFDDVLVTCKLGRIEILVFMYLYRLVWCRPNLYKAYGFSQVMSHTEIAKSLAVTIDDVYHSLRKLEDLGFIETIRSGQYFVRKYITKDYDQEYGQGYDDF